MEITVLTPFSRPKNIARLVEMLKPQGVIWSPLYHDINVIGDFIALKEDWIQPIFVNPTAWLDQCYNKLNQYIERRKLDEDMHYMVLCDDDGLEPEFTRKLADCKADVIFVSCDRGDNTVKGDNGCQHKAGCQIASPGACGRCGTNLTQYLISGKVLRQLRWDEKDPAADGGMAAMLYQLQHQGIGWSVEFKPDVWTYLNFLQDGRFNNKRGWGV